MTHSPHNLIHRSARLMRRGLALLVLSAAALAGVVQPAGAQDVRIKDITDVEGIRENQLTGAGLVVGLNGTGGRNPDTRIMVQNLLQSLGQRVDPIVRQQIRNDTQTRTDNISVVIVTTNLPAFAAEGQRLDVTVSAIDGSTSLEGGQLIYTPLLAVDNEVYAVATGPVSINGFSAGGDAAAVQKNFPTSGRIPGGATVERPTVTNLGQNGILRLLLKNPDFETAGRIAAAINQRFPATSFAKDLMTVEIRISENYRHSVSAFLADIESLRVQPDVVARVVINERTGTVVVGQNVRISQALITHANLIISTAETPEVSQPLPFSDGETEVVPRTEVTVSEGRTPLHDIGQPATVGDLARALNALGATPDDLSSIFQQLKAAGALQAELLLQ